MHDRTFLFAKNDRSRIKEFWQLIGIYILYIFYSIFYYIIFYFIRLDSIILYIYIYIPEYRWIIWDPSIPLQSIMPLRWSPNAWTIRRSGWTIAPWPNAATLKVVWMWNVGINWHQLVLCWYHVSISLYI